VPTKWTVPLQWLVVAVTVLSLGLFVATAPFVLSLISAMPQPVVVGPGVSPSEAEQMASSFRVFAVATFAVEALIGFGLFVLVVMGALRRWGWAFWLALALYGLGAVGPVVGVIFHLLALIRVTVPPPPGAAPAHVPPEPFALVVAGGVVSVGQVLTFVLMLVAAIRIGPWACRREVAEEAPPGQQPPGREAPSAA
jgi:hypothetical protein